MDPIMPAMSKHDFDAHMHNAVEHIIKAVRAGWHPDFSSQSDVRNKTDSEGNHRVIVEQSFTIVVRTEITNDDDGGTERILAPAFGTDLTKAESLAMSVLFDNKPAWALNDYLQEEGLVPVPRETVAELVYRLMGYAHSRRMNAANGKWRGTAMDNQTWGVVEGLLGELWTKLNSGEDIDQWK